MITKRRRSATKLGLYDAIPHDQSLPEAIQVVAGVGLTGLEINTGGFLPAVHVPACDDILVSDTARDDFLGLFEGTGVSVAGLNANGNPLHPNPASGRLLAGNRPPGPDPVAVVRHLGELVFYAAAKDVRINREHAALNGVLDNSFRRLSPDEPRTNLGGDEWVNDWPENSAWDFVALGKGHDAAYWTEFLRALHEVDPDMLVNIEHEDTELGRPSLLGQPHAGQCPRQGQWPASAMSLRMVSSW